MLLTRAQCSSVNSLLDLRICSQELSGAVKTAFLPKDIVLTRAQCSSINRCLDFRSRVNRFFDLKRLSSEREGGVKVVSRTHRSNGLRASLI